MWFLPVESTWWLIYLWILCVHQIVMYTLHMPLFVVPLLFRTRMSILISSTECKTELNDHKTCWKCLPVFWLHESVFLIVFNDIFKSLLHDATDSVVCVYFQYCLNCLVHPFWKKTPQQMLQNVKSKCPGGYRPCKMILSERSLFIVTSVLAICHVMPSCWM